MRAASFTYVRSLLPGPAPTNVTLGSRPTLMISDFLGGTIMNSSTKLGVYFYKNT